METTENLMRMDETVLLMTLGDPTGHACVKYLKWEVSPLHSTNREGSEPQC